MSIAKLFVKVFGEDIFKSLNGPATTEDADKTQGTDAAAISAATAAASGTAKTTESNCEGLTLPE